MSEETYIQRLMMERTIGAAVLDCVRNYEPQHLLSELNQNALQLLEQNREILDDDSLDDPECFQKIEAIVVAFHRHGLPTVRHDFG